VGRSARVKRLVLGLLEMCQCLRQCAKIWYGGLGPAGESLDGLVSEQDLVAIPVERWPELRFTFAPATQRLALRWDLFQLEPSFRSGQGALGGEPPTWVEPRGLWIGRRGHVPYFRCPDAAEDAALSQLWRGATLGDACAEWELADVGREPAQLVSALRCWLADGMLAGVSAAGAPAAVGCT